VVEARQDMLDAEAAVADYHIERALLLGHDEAGLIRRQHVPDRAAIREHKPEQHVRLAFRNPFHQNGLRHEPSRAIDLPACHDAGDLDACLRFPMSATALAHDRDETAASDADRGLLPPHHGMAR